MKNKPINSEAWGYVRLHILEKVNLDDFIIIEKIVSEMHNSFFPNGIYGDGDLRNYVHSKLKENELNIPLQLVDKIVNLLYDFLYDSDTLLPISLSINLKNWKDWEQVLQESIRKFISSYNCIPNTINLSSYTKSQLELVEGLKTLETCYFIETVDKSINVHILKYCLDDSIADKNVILEHIPYNEDDDDFLYGELLTNTPPPTFCILDY